MLKVKDIPHVDKKALRVDEMYLFYHLFRYVEVGAGIPVEEGQVRLAWQYKHKGKLINESTKAFKRLQESGNEVTKAIAFAVTLNEHEYFSHLAVQWYSPYDNETRLNKLYDEDCHRLVAQCSIELIEEMFTAPIGFLETLPLQTWQH